MNNIKVKFKEAGKWGDNPADPIFEVKEGEEREVSANLANVVVKAGKGTIVIESPEAVEPEPEMPQNTDVKEGELNNNSKKNKKGKK